jgi:uncharacterized protein
MSHEGEFERPDRKVLTMWLLSSLFSYGVIALFLLLPGFALLLLGRPMPILFAVAAVPIGLALLTHLFLRRTWHAWGFRVTDRTLEIRHGLIWRRYRIVARDRIQHIDINSGPIDRRLGLVQVVVYTAGTAVGMIPGLRPERAEALREELSSTMLQTAGPA